MKLNSSEKRNWRAGQEALGSRRHLEARRIRLIKSEEKAGIQSRLFIKSQVINQYREYLFFAWRRLLQ